MDIIRKLVEYSLRKVSAKAMFELSVFEILQFEIRTRIAGSIERKG